MMHTEDAVRSDCALYSTNDHLFYWLALWHTPGVGPVSFLKLLTCFDSPEAVLHANDAELLEQGVSDSFIKARRHTDWQAADADMQWLQAAPTHHILTCKDANYPGLLRDIADAPPLLYVLGDSHCLANRQLAIVGSRNPSAGGEQHANDFAMALVEMGLTITSGLALGIDACAHRGALSAGASTIAVVGNGLDRVYPARNRALFEQIQQQGAIVSEFPPGTLPRKENFPRRNRIISGLAVGTLVIEAARRSGSLITARLAGEQGREVFALPGSIHNPLSRGCHELIRQGAKLIENIEHIVEELGPLLLQQQLAEIPEHAPLELSAEEQHLLNKMGFEPCQIDNLIQMSGLTADAVSSMLLTMELRGVVESLPGGSFSRRQ